MESESQSHNTDSTVARRDISGFARQLLEESGIDNKSVDFAALRRELEKLENSEDPYYTGTSVAKNESTWKSEWLESDTEEGLRPNRNNDGQDWQPQSSYTQNALFGNRDSDLLISREFKPLQLTGLEDILSSIKFIVENAPMTADFVVDELSLESVSDLLQEFGFEGLDISSEINLKKSLIYAVLSTLSAYRAKMDLMNRLAGDIESFIGSPQKVPGNTTEIDIESDDITLNKLRKALEAATRDKKRLGEKLAKSEGEKVKLQSQLQGSSTQNTALQREISKIKSRLSSEEKVVLTNHEQVKNILAYVRENGNETMQENMKALIKFYEAKINRMDSASKYKSSVSDFVSDNSVRANHSGSEDGDEIIEEIETLRNEIEHLSSALQDAEEEKEIMRLKLLGNMPGSVAAKDRLLDRKVRTSQLINRDKLLKSVLDLQYFDNMPKEECISVIKEICAITKVDDISQLLESIESMCQSMNRIPKMEKYINSIDKAVWSPPSKVYELLQIQSDDDLNHQYRPHKPSETLESLIRWKIEYTDQQKRIKAFKCRVSKILGAHVEFESLETVLDRISDFLSEYIEKESDQENALAFDDKTLIQFFRKLFKLGPKESISQKMKDVYKALAQMNKWQAKFRGTLSTYQLMTLAKDIRPEEIISAGGDEIFSKVYDLLEKVASTLEVVSNLSGMRNDRRSSIDLDRLLDNLVQISTQEHNLYE